MRKIYLVPNFVTTVNMFCGFYSIIMSIRGDFVSAAWALFAAAIFDALDGRIARLAKATSQFGVEYDSLSDLTSFGMAPSILLYQWALEPFGRLGWLAAFLVVACSALRLARFNVFTDVVPKTYFQGLPTPASANMVGTFIIFKNATGWPEDATEGWLSFNHIVLSMTFILAALMVSNVRFPSFKELNWRSRGSFGYLLIAVGALVLILLRPEIMLFLIGSAYIVGSLIWNLVRILKKNTTHSNPQGFIK